MFSKCKHLWKETRRKSVPGMMETGGSVKGFADPCMIYGFTLIESECELCKKKTIEQFVGNIE